MFSCCEVRDRSLSLRLVPLDLGLNEFRLPEAKPPMKATALEDFSGAAND